MDPLDHRGLLVLQAFQGQLAFLGDLILLPGDQGSQDHLAFLEHQGCKAPQDQMWYIAMLGVRDHME